MRPIAFELLSKPLLFLHLAAAVTALASSVHLGLRLARAVRATGEYLPQTRTHASILAASYLAVFALGGLIYPAFRIRVRSDFMDAALPWATGLFEIKELLATTALLPVLGIFALSRAINPQDASHRQYLPIYFGLIAYVFCVLSFNAWCGWYLVTLRSI
ncbi:MAG: hypothetical protein HZB26_13735 [Candidatus Hydrogenedentes bacterium]|nr:hypothetical protein [Candidatus Hydrogenedentota bacterium]